MARPNKKINWEIIEKMMEAGCNGLEIANFFRIDEDVFYLRFKKKYGKSFQDSFEYYKFLGCFKMMGYI